MRVFLQTSSSVLWNSYWHSDCWCTDTLCDDAPRDCPYYASASEASRTQCAHIPITYMNAAANTRSHVHIPVHLCMDHMMQAAHDEETSCRCVIADARASSGVAYAFLSCSWHVAVSSTWMFLWTRNHQRYSMRNKEMGAATRHIYGRRR